MIAAAVALVVALAAVGLAALLAHQPPAVPGSATSPPLAWTAAQAPLPANAASGGSRYVTLFDAACPAVGNCVAVGGYSPENGGPDLKPLIETLSGGTWTVSGDVAGAGTSSGLEGVACPAQGSCIAVGGPFAATLFDGTWTATALPLPGDAAPRAREISDIGDVVCPAQGACIATGFYTDQNGDDEAVIETLSRGRWTAMRAPLPAGAVPSRTGFVTTILDGVSCPAVGSCVAVGQYSERGGATAALTDTLSGGTWTPVTIPLPTDAVAAGQLAGLFGISCEARGNCLAVGHYKSGGGQARNLAETLSGATWTAASTPLPAGAAAIQKWNAQNGGTTLNAVACQAVGSCVAFGIYTARSGAVDGAIDTLSGGTWTAAVAPLPPGAATTKQYAYFDSAVCPAPGNCVAVGTYTPQGGGIQALIGTATGKHG